MSSNKGQLSTLKCRVCHAGHTFNTDCASHADCMGHAGHVGHKNHAGHACHRVNGLCRSHRSHKSLSLSLS